MNRRARVLAALSGRPVDRIPFTAWRCAYHQAETAQGLARSTLALLDRCNLDLLVLSPSPYYMAEAWGADVRSYRSDAVAPSLGNAAVSHPTGWRRLPLLDLPSSSLQRELEAVRTVRTQLDEEGPLLVIQVPSPLATADALCSGRIIADLRAYPGDVRAGLETITSGTVQFLHACMEAGADGVFFTVPVSGLGPLRPRESRNYRLEFDRAVLESVPSASARILYLQTDQPDLALAARYSADALAWQAGPASSSLAQVSAFFRGAGIGGLDPRTFSAGSVSDLRTQIREALAATGGWRLILAPAGPLPTDARPELLAVIGDLLDELRPAAPT